jgi:bifunctional enzyme CysN/CysC
MFVGKASERKHQLARAVEKALFDAGRAAYMLDGTNVLLGIDNDLWVDAAKSELVRRFGEVVHLLLDAGHIVVSTTNVIGQADATAVQSLIPDSPLLLVEVGEGSAQPCDLLVSDAEPEAAVVAKVTALLEARQITSV